MESVRLLAQDILLIAGALSVLVGLCLLVVWFCISYKRMQTSDAIKQTIHSLVSSIVQSEDAVIHDMDTKHKSGKKHKTHKKKANKAKNTK